MYVLSDATKNPLFGLLHEAFSDDGSNHIRRGRGRDDIPALYEAAADRLPDIRQTGQRDNRQLSQQ